MGIKDGEIIPARRGQRLINYGYFLISVFGVIGWWGDFLRLLKGGILILVLGGALGIYLAVQDIKIKSPTPASEAKK